MVEVNAGKYVTERMKHSVQITLAIEDSKRFGELYRSYV